jgi:hypothetical protein
MLKFLLPIFFVTSSIYTSQVPSAEEELAFQLEELIHIDKGFRSILLEQYADSIASLEEAEHLLDPVGYFSQVKYRLVIIGKILIYSLLEGEEITESISRNYITDADLIEDPLFSDGKILSKYIGVRLNEEVDAIINSIQEDYNNPEIIYFDLGIGKLREWIDGPLKTTITEFYS